MQPHLGEASIGESLFDPEQRNVAKQCNRAKISALLIALGRVLDIFFANRQHSVYTRVGSLIC